MSYIKGKHQRRRRPYVYTQEELATIRRRIFELVPSPFCRHRNVLIFDLLRILGARPAEVCGIRIEEIDWKRGIWYLPGAREKCFNDKVFYLSYNPVLWRFLQWYRRAYAPLIERDGYLFPSRQHRKYYDANHYQCCIWRRVVDELETTKGTWRGRQLYDLRVTCFTRLVIEKKKRAEDIMALGQWTNFITPMKYYVFARQENMQAELLA